MFSIIVSPTPCTGRGFDPLKQGGPVVSQVSNPRREGNHRPPHVISTSDSTKKEKNPYLAALLRNLILSLSQTPKISSRQCFLKIEHPKAMEGISLLGCPVGSRLIINARPVAWAFFIRPCNRANFTSNSTHCMAWIKMHCEYVFNKYIVLYVPYRRISFAFEETRGYHIQTRALPRIGYYAMVTAKTAIKSSFCAILEF